MARPGEEKPLTERERAFIDLLLLQQSDKDSNMPPVYWANDRGSSTFNPNLGGNIKDSYWGKPINYTGTEAQEKIYGFFTNPAQREQFAEDMFKVGALSDPRGASDISYFAGAGDRAIKLFQASGSKDSFTDWLADTAAKSKRTGWFGADGAPTGGGGSGAYTGPVASVSKMADSDIRNLANTVSMEMVGRGVSDEEFQKIVKRTQRAEVNNPTISSGGAASNITDQGLTTVGRADIVKNIIAKQPEYEEFQKSTTLMSWFDQALSGRVK